MSIESVNDFQTALEFIHKLRFERTFVIKMHRFNNEDYLSITNDDGVFDDYPEQKYTIDIFLDSCKIAVFDNNLTGSRRFNVGSDEIKQLKEKVKELI